MWACPRRVRLFPPSMKHSKTAPPVEPSAAETIFSPAHSMAIVDLADDAIISVASDQRIILYNQGAERIFGYHAGEVIGQELEILLPERFTHHHRRDVED